MTRAVPPVAANPFECRLRKRQCRFFWLERRKNDRHGVRTSRRQPNRMVDTDVRNTLGRRPDGITITSILSGLGVARAPWGSAGCARSTCTPYPKLLCKALLCRMHYSSQK